MKNLLKLEELAMFAAAYFIFTDIFHFKAWLFWVLILTPDIGMIGYLINARAGSITYNLFHHKGIAILVGALGWFLQSDPPVIAGLILFAHSSMDRVFGYGLKYPDSFKNTHLGIIGKN